MKKGLKTFPSFSGSALELKKGIQKTSKVTLCPVNENCRASTGSFESSLVTEERSERSEGQIVFVTSILMFY